MSVYKRIDFAPDPKREHITLVYGVIEAPVWADEVPDGVEHHYPLGHISHWDGTESEFHPGPDCYGLTKGDLLRITNGMFFLQNEEVTE